MRSIGFLVGVILAQGCIEYVPEPASDPPPVEFNPAPVPGTYVTDSIVQITQPMADVLFVVDNTPSMQDGNITNIYDNFPAFMDYFAGSGIDYHVGVISTNTELADADGKLASVNGVKWIDDETVDAQNTFQQLGESIPLGSGNPDSEAGIETSYNALEVYKDSYNQGFLRDEASLHIVVMSDEDDQSGNDVIALDEFIAYLQGLGKELVTFSSIVCQDGSACMSSLPNPGTRYMTVTNEIGGVTWSIDDDDYRDVLEQLGLQAAGFHREYFLSQLPVVSTITVTVTDPEGTDFEFNGGDACGAGSWADPALMTDWTYSAARNSVTFCSYIPLALSDIVITYETLSGAEAQE